MSQSILRRHSSSRVDFEKSLYEVLAFLRDHGVRLVPPEIRWLLPRAMVTEGKRKGQQGKSHYSDTPHVRPVRALVRVKLRGRVLGEDEMLSRLLRRRLHVLNTCPIRDHQAGILGGRGVVYVVRPQILVHDTLPVRMGHCRTYLIDAPSCTALRERIVLLFQQVAPCVELHDYVDVLRVLEGLDFALDVRVVHRAQSLHVPQQHRVRLLRRQQLLPLAAAAHLAAADHPHGHEVRDRCRAPLQYG
mmetsp:Transcript_115994/g.289707  ORF Transcript_115994/g.289707 Transcript_115994/m.289707 type:complete len:246 (+) Transcript_115994:427-1164(+)